MAKFSEVVKVDDRGRIVIPGVTRKVLKLRPGTKLLMTVDDESNQIIMVPFLGKDSHPIKIRILMKDQSGSLAKIATVISELGINLLFGEARIIRKGVYAEWTIVADLGSSEDETSLEAIKERIMKSEAAIEVEFMRF
ncbi:MAG: ACT domain-containing protein [Promethearchaeota archaeon]